MKIINASDFQSIMSANDLGMKMDQLKRLADTGLQFDFTVVAVYEKKKGSKTPVPTGKFEIHTSIMEDGGKRRREVVVLTARKTPRRATLGTIFDMLRELRAKSFKVIIKEEDGV